LLMVQHVSPDRSIKELLGLKLTAVGLLKIACPFKSAWEAVQDLSTRVSDPNPYRQENRATESPLLDRPVLARR